MGSVPFLLKTYDKDSMHSCDLLILNRPFPHFPISPFPLSPFPPFPF